MTLFHLDIFSDNEITGQMLLEFCEEDIQDAFSVFKDRFTIRKALREQKSADSQTTPAVVSVTRLQTSTHQTHQVQSSTIHKPYEQQFSPPTKVGPVPNKHVISSHGAVYNQHHQQHNRQVISLVKEENSDVVPLQIHKNQAFVPPIHTISSPVKKTENYEVKSSSKELMNERVSSTDEYRHARKSHGNADDNQRNIYDCAVDALVSLSNKHTSTEYLSKTNWSNVSVASQNSSTVQSTSTAHPGPSTTHPGPISPSQLGGSNIYGLNYDCTYAWNIMSQKVKSFSADELLSKRSRFSKPTEAQRLGGILIRNAAHSAGVWKDAPCLHEISLPQRKEFYKFIVSLAPQLSNSQNILFTRLREALQNRRKYLLDKRLGKIQQRRKRGSSDISIEISEAGSFIDLTEFSGDLKEIDMNNADFTEDVYIKSEHTEPEDSVTESQACVSVKSEVDMQNQ